MKLSSLIIVLFLTSTLFCRGQERIKVIGIDNNLEFSINTSKPINFTIRDRIADTLILKVSPMECIPHTIYKHSGRYIFQCKNSSLAQEIWEVEFDLERTMQLDLWESDLDSITKLRKIP